MSSGNLKSLQLYHFSHNMSGQSAFRDPTRQPSSTAAFAPLVVVGSGSGSSLPPSEADPHYWRRIALDNDPFDDFKAHANICGLHGRSIHPDIRFREAAVRERLLGVVHEFLAKAARTEFRD